MSIGSARESPWVGSVGETREKLNGARGVERLIARRGESDSHSSLLLVHPPRGPELCWRKSIMAERGTSSPRCLSPLEGDGEQIQAILALYRFLGWDEA